MASIPVRNKRIQTVTAGATTSGRSGATATAGERATTRPAVDGSAVGGGSAVTVSRAVRPSVTVENARLPALGIGEAFLVYRCVDCGAVGSLRELPTACGECGAGRESLYYEIED